MNKRQYFYLLVVGIFAVCCWTAHEFSYHTRLFENGYENQQIRKGVNSGEITDGDFRIHALLTKSTEAIIEMHLKFDVLYFILIFWCGVYVIKQVIVLGDLKVRQ
jgi:hypothetical protein